MHSQVASGGVSGSIAGTLFDHAEQHARSRGYQFGQGAAIDIRGLCDRSEGLIVQASPADQADQIRQAKEAFTKLVDTMIAVRDEVYGPDNQDNIIGEETLKRALSLLCPLFPLC